MSAGLCEVAAVGGAQAGLGVLVTNAERARDLRREDGPYVESTGIGLWSRAGARLRA